MRGITSKDVTALLEERPGPCISVYLPSPRDAPDALHRLAEQAAKTLRREYADIDVEELLLPLRRFPLEAEAATALFLSRDEDVHAFDLSGPVPARGVVGESFDLKPILRSTQSYDRFHLLVLQPGSIKLYEGDSERLTLVKADDVPLTAAATLLTPAAQPAGTTPGMAAARSDTKTDCARFFRAVDRGVTEHVTQRANLPLLVVGPREQLAVFRAVARNPRLLPEIVEQNSTTLDERRLHIQVWPIIEPHLDRQTERLAEDYHVGNARRLASDSLPQVVSFAHDGRIGLLLIEQDRTIPGRIDPRNGTVEVSPEGDDILDALAELVLRRKGRVVVMPSGRMPTASGVAGVFRY